MQQDGQEQAGNRCEGSLVSPAVSEVSHSGTPPEAELHSVVFPGDFSLGWG